jgi:spermidine/putrescine transport system permease protein
LLVGLSAAAIAIILGVPGALLVDRYNFPFKRIFQKFVLLPLILPGIVTGVAFQSFYAMLGLPRSLVLVALAHGTALTSTVLTTVYARLLRFDPSIEEASMDLGADRMRTFWRVTLPNLRTAIIAAGLLAFTLSFDEIPVTIFITGDGGNTLPMVLWSTLRRASKPEYVAFTVLVLLIGVVVVTIAARITEELPAPVAEAGG